MIGLWYAQFLDIDELDVDTVMERVSRLCKVCRG